jgi:uncharacterized protein (TIGR02145 family)
VADASEMVAPEWRNSHASDQVYEYIFTTRLINIETGLIISFSSGSVVRDDYNDKRYLRYRIEQGVVVTITDNLITELLQNVNTTAGKQKLAIYVTRSSSTFEGKTASSRLIQNFTNSGIYAAVDRTSDFQKEIGYQYTGRVEDSQLTKLGRQLGVNIICIVDVLSTDYTDVRMVDVTTGIITATAQANSWRMAAIDKITHELFECVKKGQKITSPLMKCCEGLILVDGICKDPNEDCMKKDEKIIVPFKCCEGLTLIDSVCRDLSSGSAYWLKDKTGMEVMYDRDVSTSRDALIKNPDAVCPAGWRLPTKEEFERILTVKDQLKNLRLADDYYVTSPETVSDKGHTYIYVWQYGRYRYSSKKYKSLSYYGLDKRCIYTNDKKYKKKDIDMLDHQIFVRCVRD